MVSAITLTAVGCMLHMALKATRPSLCGVKMQVLWGGGGAWELCARSAGRASTGSASDRLRKWALWPQIYCPGSWRC